MKLLSLAFISTSVLLSAPKADSAPASDGASLAFPQMRAAEYDDIRRNQTLGRFVVAPDASLFVYEWARPYIWAPRNGRLSREAAARKQTFLYKVTTPENWEAFNMPTSEELLPPAPGATYYLGDLSPDGDQVSFYELDRDTNKARAGVVQIKNAVITNEADAGPPRITWFDMEPDDARLDQPPAWFSNQEIVYAVKGGPTGLARGSLLSGKAQVCIVCTPDMLIATGSAKPPVVVSADSRVGLPASAKQIAGSQDGRLQIFSVDTPEVLSLAFRKKDRVVILFDNRRKK